MALPQPQKPGLPAERTLLSWERSALGFLVGGVLLMIRHHGPFGPVRAVLAFIAAGLALSVLAVGYRRARVIGRSQSAAAPTHLPAAHTEVVWIGTATAVFAVIIVGVLTASTLSG
ncbi:DUF202 domain-containing protein [Mycolicibacterium bacteremicum]|uniref:DUF202 domain-containing protein n=1 Tax=Mycolicibacterium bacteremicum TaxID=564198 RepID=UPI0026EAB33D|nr:DUF202 domain-containing protein [Mycolicibacterium bacteremicum]